MKNKKIIWLSVAGAAAVAIIVAIGVQAFASPDQPAGEAAPKQEVTKAEVDTGPDKADTEESHARVNLTEEEMNRQIAEGDMILPGEVPEKVQRTAEELAKLWVTFDSRDEPSARAEQLSKVIPNAEDWTTLPAEVASPGDIGYGDPTSYAISESTNEPAAYATWTFSVDGINSVAVQTPLSAKYYSGNGAMRGTLDDTYIFQFKFNADGELVEVIPPEG